jgi:hypothetical protein
MGLTTWKHAPDGKILKSDVGVAKNYPNERHVRELNRIVSAYLDLAENRAVRGIVMKMADWAKFLNDFLTLSNYPILADLRTPEKSPRSKRNSRPGANTKFAASGRIWNTFQILTAK